MQVQPPPPDSAMSAPGPEFSSLGARAYDLTLPQWETHLEELGEPAFRAKQIYHWLHQRHAGAYRIMTDTPESLREQLESKIPIKPLELVEQRTDPSDRTVKALWRLEDGELIETVRMVMTKREDGDKGGDENKESGARSTICLSSQTGCALACRFCATGQLGERRNLTPGEIVQQAYRLWESEPPVKRLVFMGMGEPLRNYDNVLAAIELFRNEDGLNLSPRRITISTVGLVPEIYRLASDKPGVRLAVSLHGTTDAKRQALAPVARGYTLERVMDAVRAYQAADGQRVSFEYTLLPGHNDSGHDAERLVELISGLVSHVNIIPYNPVDRTPFKQPKREDVFTFFKRLQDAGVSVSIRWSRGPKIKAACGQLRADFSE